MSSGASRSAAIRSSTAVAHAIESYAARARSRSSSLVSCRSVVIVVRALYASAFSSAQSQLPGTHLRRQDGQSSSSGTTVRGMPDIPISYPGVYVEEIPVAGRAIEGVATSTTAFIGGSVRGPTDRPRLVTSSTDFERVFGGPTATFPWRTRCASSSRTAAVEH